ncbi:MAG: hypothetical protein OXG69_05745 [bacterium]|nr:hypothetical protein [bacterium]
MIQDWDEVDRNYSKYIESYKKDMELEHSGRIALMADGKVVSIHDDVDGAYEAGYRRYGLGHFSYVEIGARPPIDMGLYASALMA